MGNQETDTEASLTSSAQAVEVNCENCGARVFWKPGPQALACEHCGTLRQVPRLAGQVLERSLEEGRRMERVGASDELGVATRAMGCENCGARVLLVERDISTHCAFCGSGQVLPSESLRRAIQPESVIPLMLSREDVAKAFRKWLSGLWFRPSALKELKAFAAQGIYVPAWTFDAEADSSWTAEAGHYYYVTQTYTVQVNGKSQTRTRQVRKVRWVPASGQRSDFYDDLQVMASKGIDRNLALELGGFETADLVPYQPEYLVGWEAEEYAIDLEDGWARGQDRMLQEQRSRCSGDVPGDTQRNLRVRTDLSQVHWKHVLLPVWSLTYRFGGKSYAVLIHGQSGRVAGKAPFSWVKITGAVVLALVVAAIAIVALSAR
ncbi:MAG: primosomal protein N' (replication factor Y) - superfamily II helicase [Planctomycetota bacterium]|nr:primosomal protein N' (replication factor Y) - superfamily II helicase [Planctomycetota bacterium]